MRVLDLFSGIGGFSLGLERAGMQTIQFVEIDPFCRAVLAKHWPGVPIHDDVRTFHAPAGFADVICGGFPCQDISVAGKGAGLAGDRSGLWSEYARIIGEVRPRFVVVENVAALLARGLGDVLGDLAALGFDAEWHCIPAAAVGAPHVRDRVWIVAYTGCERDAGRGKAGDMARQTRADQGAEAQRQRDGYAARDGGAVVADADYRQRAQRGPFGRMGWGSLAATDLASAQERTVWPPEPALPRVVDGLPNRLHRLRALGNSIVPQIAELIGRAIMRTSPGLADLHTNVSTNEVAK